jgi:PAS domain S-box-containing protein
MKTRAEASERLSSEIIASMSSGLIVVRADGFVFTVNPAGERMLGLTAPEGGRPFREVLVRAAPLVAVIEEALADGKPIVRRTLELPEGGSETHAATHLGVSVSPLRHGDQLQGVICLFTDLSAIAGLEEQLRLRESLSTLGEMTAGIAHEFRNGLATIHGYSRLIDLDRLPPDYRPFMTAIREETEALNQVVTNFLNFARPVPLSITAVDLRAIAQRLVDEMRPDVAARGGEVRMSGEWPVIEGDEVLLRQALSNLCRNAVEACAGHPGAPEISLGAAPESSGDSVRLTVSDNGPGVERGAGDRIFRPFFTTKATGHGLGLALVQKIVVTHGGRITFSDQPGGGARFQIELPIRQREVTDERRAAANWQLR